MSDFFDRVVARANGGGRGAAALEPRTASRYASPEQHLELADAPPASDARASDEEAGGPPAREPRFDPGNGEALAPRAGATDARHDRAWAGGVEARLTAGARAADESAAQASEASWPPSLSPVTGAHDPSDPTRAPSPFLIGPAKDGAGAAPTSDASTPLLPPPPADAAQLDAPKDAATSSAPFSTEDAFWNFLYPSSSSSSSPSPSPSSAAAPAAEPAPSPWSPPGAPLRPAFAAGGRDPQDNAAEAPVITVSIGRIDVRGLPPPPPPPRPSAPARRGPRLGLQEYMQKSGPARSGGSSR